MSKVFNLGVYGIQVIVNDSIDFPSGGQISSDLRDETDENEDAKYRAAIDGLESLILAHACAGIDITSPAYLEGIEVAVDAISNNA